VVELREEVTWARARAAVIMAEARTTWAKKMAQERVVLLATTDGEVNVAAQRVFILEGKLVATCRAQDTAEGKLPSLATKVAAANRQRVAVEEQCERLVHDLTLHNLIGFELCMTIIGAPLQPPYTRE
jgi:hypothetical protein